MCAPASLNELIRWFFLYLLQLLRSGSVCSAVPTRGNLRISVLMSCGLRMTIDAVFWSSFAKSSLQLTPLEPSSYSDVLSVMVFMGSASAKSRKWLRSLHSTERACEHMRSRAAQKRAGTAAHSPAFTAAPFENTPVVSCSTLHFVLPSRTQRNVSVNSGDTLYK